MTSEEQAYWVTISMIPGIGPRRFQKLLDFFGSAKAAWQAPAPALSRLIGANPALDFLDFRGKVNPLARLENLRKKGISFFLSCDPGYPGLLAKIYDPPPVLYYKGEIKPVDQMAVAVVGSRSATPNGVMIAEELARGLAEMGITVISGLARGIDSAAHRGALKGGNGRTIAVLGSGLDRIYPPENTALAEEIMERGAVCSEYPPGTEPLAQNFPARNRIISGLSLGVTVVEATEDSGSLITVDFALEQGRDVFAVPGPINKKRSRGTNHLIKEGAVLVDCVDDILQTLGFSQDIFGSACGKEQAAAGTLEITPVEAEILTLLAEEEYHVDILIRLTRHSPGEIQSTLALLKVKGEVTEISPGVYRRCK